MSVLISLLLAFAIGWLIVRCVNPLRHLENAARWARTVFSLSLALITGIASTSILFFLLRTAGLSPLPFEAAEVCLLAFVALRRPARSGNAARPASGPLPWVLLALFCAVLIPTGVREFHIAWANPYGDWDAWANWNQRARFLTGANDWRNVASPLLEDGNAHPEYPLLLPAFIARSWTIAGDTGVAIPAITGLLFSASLLGLFTGAVGLLAGNTAAALGGMILLSAQPLLHWAPAQYADIPLACFIVSTTALLLLGSPALIFAGLCAGFAAWTKQEGMLFALAAIAFNLLAARTSGLRRWWRFPAGAAPGFALSLWYALWIAPPGADHPHSFSQVLSLATDFQRYRTTASAFLDHLGTFGSGPGHPLILLAILALLLRPEPDRRRATALRVAAATLAFLLASYLFAYVISPRDLTWHLNTSMDRLLLQIWPAALLTFCAFLPRNLDNIIGNWRAISEKHAATECYSGLQMSSPEDPIENKTEPPAPEAASASSVGFDKKTGIAILILLALGIGYLALNRSSSPSQPAPSAAVNPIAVAEAAAKLHPTPENYLNLSLAYHQAQRFQESLTAAREAIQLRPNYAEAWNNVAAAYEDLKQWDLAIGAAQQALKIKPDFQLAKNNLAWSLSQKGLQPGQQQH